MKYIEVNKKLCEGCGLCIINCSYLQEDDDGDAEAVKGRAVLEQDLPAVKKVIKECPVKALKLVDTNRGGKKDFDDIKKSLIKELKEIMELPYPRTSEYQFKKEEYDIEWPDAAGERDYEYSSYEKAVQAGTREFDRIMYSKCEIIMLRIFMEYKTTYLKKFYSDEKGNYYEENNKKISDLLLRCAAELSEENGESDLPEDFAEFKVYPDRALRRECERNEVMGKDIVSKIYENFRKESYHKLSAYKDYIEVDQIEEYMGSGFFGDKFKTKWCYYRVYLAEKQLAEDILSELYFSFPDMVERDVERLIDHYNWDMKKELEHKIEIIQKIQKKTR